MAHVEKKKTVESIEGMEDDSYDEESKYTLKVTPEEFEMILRGLKALPWSEKNVQMLTNELNDQISKSWNDLR